MYDYLVKSFAYLAMPVRFRHPRLSEEALEAVAARFRILGEPTRLRILRALEPGEMSVTDIVAATGASQANVSRHLRTLVEGGLLRRRKEGLNVFYAINDETIFDLCDEVCRSVARRLASQTRGFTG